MNTYQITDFGDTIGHITTDDVENSPALDKFLSYNHKRDGYTGYKVTKKNKEQTKIEILMDLGGGNEYPFTLKLLDLDKYSDQPSK